jgi:hypothetical protein
MEKRLIKGERGGLTRFLVSFLIIASMANYSKADEVVTVNVSKIKNLSLRIYGFVETDVINDSTQGLVEEPDNPLIAKITAAGGAPNFPGNHSQTIISDRNSRLGFNLSVPATDEGVKTEGVIELDLLGNNAPNTIPPAAPGTQSERDFFNNAAVRVRHAFVNVTSDHWGFRAGQYWSLLGFQPYYFPSEPIVQPAVGQLYRRFPQLRLTNTATMGDWMYELAADIAKPAEMNSGDPEYHAGFRLSSTKTKAATLPGSGTAMVGLSAAISGAVIPIRTAIDSKTGTAIAGDIFIPIIPSSDGKDKSNNLSIMGEICSGSGIGGLEMAGLTSGIAKVSGGPSVVTIDSGIAGLNTDGNLELLHFRTARMSAQYTLPSAKWTISGGVASSTLLNAESFGAGTGIAPRISYGYGSVFFEPLAWLRFGAEYGQFVTAYNDPANDTATNNRTSFTTYFVF